MGVYQRLGVQPVINARGMNTMASGSLMPQPVLDAMAEAATAFVDMEELNRKAGEHIARLIGVEAAHVTSGSAGGLLLSAAAVIAGDGPGRDRPAPGHHRPARRHRHREVPPDPVRPGAADGRRPPDRGRRRGRLHAGADGGRHRRPHGRHHVHRLAVPGHQRRDRRAGDRHRPPQRPPDHRGRRLHPAAGQPPDPLDLARRGPGDLQRRQGDPGPAGQRPAARAEGPDPGGGGERRTERRHRSTGQGLQGGHRRAGDRAGAVPRRGLDHRVEQAPRGGPRDRRVALDGLRRASRRSSTRTARSGPRRRSWSASTRTRPA